MYSLDYRPISGDVNLTCIFLCFQNLCDSDEVKIGHKVYSLDYRPISDDVNLTCIFLCFQNLCDSDEVKIGHKVYSLDYRPISGDVNDKRNSFSTPSFKPHGKLVLLFLPENLY